MSRTCSTISSAIRTPSARWSSGARASIRSITRSGTSTPGTWSRRYRTPGRARDEHPREDPHLVEQPELAAAGHEQPHLVEVEADLGLDELRSRLDLHPHPHRAELERRGERVLDRPDQEARRPGERTSREVDALVPHDPRDGAGAPSRCRRSAWPRDGPPPTRRRRSCTRRSGRRAPPPQQVRLQGEAVPVPAHELHDRLDPSSASRCAAAERRDVRVRGAVVGAVHRVDAAAQQFREPRDRTGIGRVARLELRRDHELAREQQLVQPAPGLGHAVRSAPPLASGSRRHSTRLAPDGRVR